MSDSSNTLHEAVADLPPEVIDRHRAIVSLMEEMEAVDWYDQRVQACSNPELKEILAHNRDEEKEHAAMVIEWLRRNDAGFEAELKDYLFKDGSITGHEQSAHAGDEDGGAAAPAAPLATGASHGSGGSLGIGSLRVNPEDDK